MGAIGKFQIALKGGALFKIAAKVGSPTSAELNAIGAPREAMPGRVTTCFKSTDSADADKPAVSLRETPRSSSALR